MYTKLQQRESVKGELVPLLLHGFATTTPNPSTPAPPDKCRAGDMNSRSSQATGLTDRTMPALHTIPESETNTASFSLDASGSDMSLNYKAQGDVKNKFGGLSPLR